MLVGLVNKAARAIAAVELRGENALTILFAGCVGFFLVHPLWRMFFPLEIDRNEAWNAFHVDSILQGLPLYPTDALITNNYPPLSFFFVAVISYLTGDVVFAGRLISVVGMFGTAACLFGCVSALNGSYRGASLGALWFVAMIARPFRNYAAMNDPQLLALFFMAGGFLWFLRCLPRGRSPIGPLLLMVGAGFFKHNLIAIPTAAIAWLIIVQGTTAFRAIAVAALAALGALALCVACFGRPFLMGLLYSRALSWSHFAYRMGTLQWVAPAMMVCAAGLWQDWMKRDTRLIGLLLLTSVLAYLLQSFGEGVGENAIFEMTFALAIGVGVFLDRLVLLPGTPIIITSILLLRLVLAPGAEFAGIIASTKYRNLYASHADIFQAEVERIRSIGRQVNCSIMSVCRSAGKPFVYDEFHVGNSIKTGSLDSSQVERLVSERNVALRQIDPRAAASSLDLRWSDLGR